MIHLPVHTFTRKTIIAEFGSDVIRVDAHHPLMPFLVAKPCAKKTALNATITIVGAGSVIGGIRIDSGHNLYQAHMHQLVEWIDKNVTLDRQAWTSMMEYYAAIGLDMDELPPERTYKRWQRWSKRKNKENKLYKSALYVLKNTTPPVGGLNDVLRSSAHLIQDHPDLFFTSSGSPDAGMIRKSIIYTMADLHRWNQNDIAGHFGISQQAVSKHLSSFRSMIYLHRSAVS